MGSSRHSQEYIHSCAHTYLYFKSEVFLQVFNNHDKEWKFNAQRLLWVCRTRDVCGAVEKETPVNTLLILSSVYAQPPTAREDKLKGRSASSRHISQWSPQPLVSQCFWKCWTLALARWLSWVLHFSVLGLQVRSPVMAYTGSNWLMLLSHIVVSLSPPSSP